MRSASIRSRVAPEIKAPEPGERATVGFVEKGSERPYGVVIDIGSDDMTALHNGRRAERFGTPSECARSSLMAEA
jgi:hypothetical protein